VEETEKACGLYKTRKSVSKINGKFSKKYERQIKQERSNETPRRKTDMRKQEHKNRN